MKASLDDVWIILDALDECVETTGKQGLLSCIQDWNASTATNLHLLVTSRPEQHIECNLKGWIQETVSIQSNLVEDDIRAYVLAKVHSLSRWKDRPEVRDEIERVLMEKANGMFRWVSCQLDILEDCLDLPLLQNALRILPKTLDDTYARIIRNIPSHYQRYTYRLLQALVLSERPLQLDEAVDLIAVNIDSDKRPRFDPRNRMPVPEEVSRCCSSLVSIRARPRTRIDETQRDSGSPITEIRLAHFSVKEYLVSGRLDRSIAHHFDEVTARGEVACICLAYLLDLDHHLSIKNTRCKFPLAQYSAEYGATHAMMAEKAGSTRAIELSIELFCCQEAYETLDFLYDDDHPLDQEPRTPLYYTSFMGLTSAARALLEKGAEANAHGGRWGNALQAASRQGHVQTIKMLFEMNADANVRGRYRGSALYLACLRGNAQTVRVLLEHGADIAKGGYYGDPLNVAAWKGSLEIVQVLLENGAEVNTNGGYFGSALQAASSGGRVEIVELLLEKGAEIGTALRDASCKGHIEVVKLLLERGGNVNKYGGGHYTTVGRNWVTALQAASGEGHVELVELLLENGANVNAQEADGNALKAASQNHHVAIVQMLLENETSRVIRDRPELSEQAWELMQSVD